MAQDKKVRVALDAMGGDFAPGEMVKGAVLAAQKGDVEIALVGPRDIVERELAKYETSDNLPIHLVEASEVIKENESPALAVYRKPNSSIVVAAKLVKSGEVDIFISAGSSGAIAVSAMQIIGMAKGMDRPAIGGTLGSFAPDIVMVDMGANVDCKPHHLLTFAIAGSVFAKRLLNIANPTIGLLSTGVEESKGSEAVREAHAILKDSGLNFIGNIEGNEILSGRASVVVCDGFVGNVVLKFYESMGNYASSYLQRRLKKYSPLRVMSKLVFNKLFPVTKISHESEEEGGLLWGVDGVVRMAHGTSRAPQIVHGIASAKKAVEADVVGCLKAELEKFQSEGRL